MPLVLMCGFPCCGKSDVANALATYLRQECETKFKVVVIEEEDDLSQDKVSTYASSHLEKRCRGKLRTSVEHALTADTIVIVDSLNYIKGFRYELFCLCKSLSTTYAVIFPQVAFETTLDWNNTNNRWKPTMMRELSSRFETPNGNNRWDKPLFCVSEADMVAKQYPLPDIAQALLFGVAKKASFAVKSPNLGGINFVTELDSVTRKIIAELLLRSQLEACTGPTIPVPCANKRIEGVFSPISTVQAGRWRRQFIKMMQVCPLENNQVENIGNMFVDYINTQIP